MRKRLTRKRPALRTRRQHSLRKGRSLNTLGTSRSLKTRSKPVRLSTHSGEKMETWQMVSCSSFLVLLMPRKMVRGHRSPAHVV